MHDKIRLIGTEILSNDWGCLTRVTLDYRRAGHEPHPVDL